MLRYGGVYADIDTECKRPLDDIVQSRDTLVVGWENEFPLPKAAVDAWYVFCSVLVLEEYSVS